MTDKVIFQGSVRAGKTAAIIATLTAERDRYQTERDAAIKEVVKWSTEAGRISAERDRLRAECDAAVLIIEEFIDLDDNEYISSETWVNFKIWYDLYINRLQGGEVMSDIKYEDIYFMIKDVAYDQENPVSAYKKIEEQIIKSESGRDYYKRLAEAAEEWASIMSDNHLLGDDITEADEHKQYQAFQNYNSILQEREAHHEG